MEVIKDVAILALMVFLARKKVQFGHIFVICAFLFGLTHGMSPLLLGSLIKVALTSEATLTVCGAVYLIILLEKIMRQSGSLDRLVSGLKNLSGDPRFPMAALPALIGLLPSPGGARFSAPLVEEVSRDLNITNDSNAAVNYYFRHVWEYFLPFTGGNLLALQILEMPVSRYIALLFPFSVVAIFSGLLIYRNTSLRNSNSSHPSPENWKNIAEGLGPVAATVFLALAFDLEMVVALLLVEVSLFFIYRLEVRLLPSMLKSSFEYRLLYLIFGAVYLREVLVQSGSIDQLLLAFNTIGLQPVAIALVFPLVIALLTGLSYPGISIALPVILTMATPDNLQQLIVLTLAGNVAGLLLSPVHPCFIVSVHHFSANIFEFYKKIIIPEIILLVFALIYIRFL